MKSEDSQAVLMCYGKTPYTPGSYMERALRRCGFAVDVITNSVDFSRIDQDHYRGVLFVESPSMPAVTIVHREQVKVPVIHWITHGENRLKSNRELAEIYRPDLVLMSHSLHLAPHFPAPVRFYPFAADSHIFKSDIPYAKRTTDIAFAGEKTSLYSKRGSNLHYIQQALGNRASCVFEGSVYLEKLAERYGNARMVFNQTANTIQSLNMRIFEGMSCGALMITDEVPQQSQLFRKNEHYIIFESQDDLLDKLNYYLDHPEEAERIANAGHQHVLSNHTYEHRAKALLDYMTELG